LDHPQNDKSSVYQYVCKNGNVPFISGGMLRATWPHTEEYCKNGLLLHWPNWHTLSDIKDDQTNWNNKFHEFLLTEDCPNFIKADLQQARLGCQNQVMLLKMKALKIMTLINLTGWM
jgi:hypothetical protein